MCCLLLERFLSFSLLFWFSLFILYAFHVWSVRVLFVLGVLLLVFLVEDPWSFSMLYWISSVFDLLLALYCRLLLRMLYLRDDMLDSNITKNLNRDLLADPNENYNILHCHLKSLKDKHMPEKYVKLDKHRHKKNNWITYGILRSIKFRDNLYMKYKPGVSTINGW